MLGRPDVDDRSSRIWWRRFLDQATNAQKLLLALGGIAGAVLAIGALTLAIGDLLGDDGGSGVSGSGDVPSLASLDGTTITSNSDEADALIAGLLEVAGTESRTVTLDVKVLAHESQPALNSADIWVYFNCASGPCSKARLQFPRVEAIETNPLGFDLTGTWEVSLARGLDFASRELDIELVRTAAAEAS